MEADSGELALHEGLCALEYDDRAARASLSALQLRIRGEESLDRSLHESLTAWGRAPHADRDRAEREASAHVRDLRAEITRRARQTRDEAGEVGAERAREFERQRAQGHAEGERSAREWLTELTSRFAFDESSARAHATARISAWSRLPTSRVDHDVAGSAWRRVLDDGSLIELCLTRALDPPEDPSSALPTLRAVSPHRLGEVLASGMRAGEEARRRALALADIAHLSEDEDDSDAETVAAGEEAVAAAAWASAASAQVEADENAEKAA